MTDPRGGDIVRYKNCTTHYRIIKKKERLWMSVIGSMSEFIMPPLSKLVLVSRPIIDTSGFDAIESASNNDTIDAMAYANKAMSDYNAKDVIMTDKMMRHAKNYDRGTATMAGILNRMNTNKENKMSISINSLVAKVTDNIKDAQLVTQYFGHELNEGSIKDEYFVRDNYDDLLEEATAREEKRLAAEKSCAS